MSAFTTDNVQNTIGAETIGAACALFLGGVCYQQAFRYFSTYPRDRWQFKLLVVAISCLNLAHSGTLINMIYSWDVLQWGSPGAADSSPRSYNVLGILSGIIITTVQCFYAYRIYAMKRSFIIPFIVVIGSFVQLGTNFTTAAYVILNIVQSSLQQIRGVTIAIVVSSSLVDLVITITILQSLRRTSSRICPDVNSDEIDIIIRKIAILSIQTNAVATLLAIVTMFIFLLYSSGWHNATYFICVKCYIISLLAVLNARPIPTDLETTNALFYASAPPALFFNEVYYNSESDPSDILYNSNTSNSIPLNNITHVHIDSVPPKSVTNTETTCSTITQPSSP